MSSGFEGIIAPITTPFSDDGEVSIDGLHKNLDRYRSTPLSGVLVTGTTGEGAHLSVEERVAVLKEASDVWPEDKRLLVGVSFAALRQSLRFVETIARYRSDALLVSVPSYYKSRMNDRALADYFIALADRAHSPLLLYNIPRFSGIELSLPLVTVLAQHENIAGIKESSGNLVYLQKILAATAKYDFEVISGSAETFGPALALGIRGGILAVSCAVPEVVMNVMKGFESGAEFVERHSRLFEISSTVVGKLSVPGVKYAMDLKGYCGGICRPPLLPLTVEEKSEVEAVLEVD
jgi:4-hydroxy-2-oxoglutarate aldolase